MAAPIRRTGRVILLDPADRVLLLRFAVTKAGKPFEFWATPGGAVEGQETDIETATRELREEVQLDLPLKGPVHTHESVFEVNGRTFAGQDIFFVARCGADDPVFSGGTEPDEREALQEMRWWGAKELANAGETVFPPGLATIVRQLVT